MNNTNKPFYYVSKIFIKNGGYYFEKISLDKLEENCKVGIEIIPICEAMLRPSHHINCVPPGTRYIRGNKFDIYCSEIVNLDPKM